MNYKPLLRNSDILKFELPIIAMAILLFIFRTAIPFFKYPFLLLFVLYSGYSIIKHRTAIIKYILRLCKCMAFPLALLLIIVIQGFMSDKFYLIVFKDIINTLVLFTLVLLLSITITNSNHLKAFYSSFSNLIIAFGLIISLFNIFVIFDIFSFNDFEPGPFHVSGGNEIPVDIDNNFALLPVLFGMFATLFPINEKKSNILKYTFVFLVAFFSLTVLLSASRRGLIFFTLVTLVLIAVKFVYLLKPLNKNEILKRTDTAANTFFLSLIMLFIFSFSILSFTTYKSKSNILQLLGTRNVSAALNRVTSNIFEYVQVINKNISYSDLFYRLWKPKIDPKDPDSGWGARNHKTVYPLTGNNAGILPPGSKGYYLDNTCDAITREGNAYAYTLVWNKNLNKSCVKGASVYCYVSEDFDGTYAMLAFEGPGNLYRRTDYDLEKKGTWQRLSIDFTYADGEFPVYFYISKFGVPDLTSLKGYVIFAHPQINSIQVLHPDYLKNSSGDIHGVSLIHKGSFMNWNINMNVITTLLPNSLTKTTYGSEVADKDPIRRWISELISEDTSFTDLKSGINPPDNPTGFISMRTARWRFAIQIFKKEFTITEKLFGGGFNFLNWYGYYFLKDKTARDWPHNPFLSVLLYSGLMGLLLYSGFIVLIFYLYFIHFKEYPLLLIFFLITFFFTFFSGTSPFDPPMMGFFVLFPFLIDCIHNENRQEVRSNFRTSNDPNSDDRYQKFYW